MADASGRLQLLPHPAGPVGWDGGNSALRPSSEAAFHASDNPAPMFIKNKHMASFGGRYAKFDSVDISEVQGWVADGLRSAGALFKPNGIDGTVKVEIEMGQVVGTKGQTGIRVIVSDAGEVINAFPFDP